MPVIRSHWFLILLLFICVVVFLSKTISTESNAIALNLSAFDSRTEEWQPIDENLIPPNDSGELIRYGKDLITHTANFLGPEGSILQISNGMNCQNCHLNAGTVLYANPFSAVSSTYPKYRDRSGRQESIEWRINECMERSLNGKKLDSDSREMKAMIAYFNWLGKGVPKGFKPKGSGIEELPYLNRAADTAKGRQIYVAKCQSCHGSNGAGVLNKNAFTYLYPPLWGENSYNVSAGMYRLSRLAGFVKNNMPYGASYQNPQMTNEEAWDDSAFINAQPRTHKIFAYDWPNITTKPVDHPFGPFADDFSETEHKYGPFAPIKTAREAALQKKASP